MIALSSFDFWTIVYPFCELTTLKKIVEGEGADCLSNAALNDSTLARLSWCNFNVRKNTVVIVMKRARQNSVIFVVGNGLSVVYNAWLTFPGD